MEPKAAIAESTRAERAECWLVLTFSQEAARMRRILALALLLVPSWAWAEPFVLDLPPGTHNLSITVAADGTVSARPLRTVTVGGGPVNPNPPVDPDPMAEFIEEIRKATADALALGGSKTSGAALSAVYSLVGSGVADGSIAPGVAFTAVRAASDKVLAGQPDKDKWTVFRTRVSNSLNALKADGLLETKEQVSGILANIAKGIDKATGQSLDAKALGRATKGEAGAYDTDGKADGILDGIDLAKLIELIKLIIELLKIFGGGF